MASTPEPVTAPGLATRTTPAPTAARSTNETRVRRRFVGALVYALYDLTEEGMALVEGEGR